MSIIRLSVLGDGIYAPDLAGNITPEAFSLLRGANRRGEGRMPLYVRGVLTSAGDPLVRYLERSLAIEAAVLPDDKPVTILIHGFQFDPATTVMRPPHHHKADNPHARLYHFEEHPEEVELRHHSTSWPRWLGYQQDDAGAEGLTIGFGWYSNPGFFSSLFAHGMNFYAKAYEYAEDASWQLVCVIHALTGLLGRPVDVFCHSLGSRVVIRALANACSPAPNLGPAPPMASVIEAVDRVLMLAGAEKVLEAQLMMSRLNRLIVQGAVTRTPDFYNFVSRENDVLDKLGENFGPAAPGSKQVVGHNGLEALDPGWVDIQLDDYRVAAWFMERGYRISGDNLSSIFAVLDHWIHYTWRPNMRLYHDILRDRATWSPEGLKDQEEGTLFNVVRRLRGAGALGFGD